MTTEQSRVRMDKIDRLPRPRRVEYVDTTVGGIPAIVISAGSISAAIAR